MKKTQSRDAMLSYYMIVEPFGLNKEHKNVITTFGALTTEYFGRELLTLWQNIQDNDNKGRKSPGPSVSETLVTVPQSCLSGLLVSAYIMPLGTEEDAVTEEDADFWVPMKQKQQIGLESQDVFQGETYNFLTSF